MAARKKRRDLTVEETIPLGNAVRHLDSALARLDELLASDYRWVSVGDESSPSAAMAKVRAAYTEIDGDPSPDRRALPGCRAIVAVTPRVIAAACSVNNAKTELQAVCKGLRGMVYVGMTCRNDRVTRNPSRLSLALEAVGRPDLNMFAAYRKVPILTGAPRRVVLTIRQSRAVYRTPRDTIANRLRSRSDADSIDDLSQIQQLQQSEATLALLTTSRPFPEAGVWFDGFDARGRSYFNFATGMPIIYVAAGATPAVEYKGSTHSPSRKPVVVSVCPNQYLKTMRVHRYLRYMEEAEQPRS